jgi:hypothetical protein
VIDSNGRGERIRTSDPLVPNQVLYQAEPLPEHMRQHAYQRVRPGLLIRWMRSHECSRIRRPQQAAIGASAGRHRRLKTQITDPNSHSPDLLFLLRRHGSGKDTFDRSPKFLNLVRVGERLAWHHLITLRGVVDEDGFDGGDLLQVGGL